MASTNFTTETALTMQTTTTNTDDQAHLLKSTTSSAKKKKNSIFKSLFHFGSKKGRSKSMDPGKNSINNKNNNSPESSTICSASQNEEMKHFSPNYRHKYQQEQERINAQYRKLLEEQKQRQLQQQQQQRHSGFVRNQLHPMHQSMPLSSSYRSKSGVSPRNQQQQQQQTSEPPQVYDVMNTVGVPHVQSKSSDSNNVKPMNAYIRSHHRIHPQESSAMFNDNNVWFYNSNRLD